MAKKLSNIRQQLEDAGYPRIVGISEPEINKPELCYLYDEDFDGPTYGEQDPESIPEKTIIPDPVCPYAEHGAEIGTNYNQYQECDDCEINRECKALSMPQVVEEVSRAKSEEYFSKIPWAFNQNIIRDNLTFSEVRILLSFMQYTDWKTNETHVANTRLMDELNISQATMIRAIKKFKKLGYIVDKGKHSHGWARNRIINLNP